MEKLRMTSADLTGENIERIAAMFPHCIVEAKNDKGEIVRAVDFDLLRAELSKDAVVVEGDQERYVMNWPDKKKAILTANAPIAKTLRPCRAESVNYETTQNLYIEGDNLDVLKLLRETYLGKVKMIYIDPPYNTGNDFVYEDDFAINSAEYLTRSRATDENGNRMFQNNDSNGRFHTDWLNMMFPRLKLARDLLTDDGVILINMDENEITNLQKICTEIFGAGNDLGTIVWDKRNPKGDARGISYQHEYIVMFAKNRLDFLSKCKLTRPKKNARIMLMKATQIFNKLNMTFTLDDVNAEFAAWVTSHKDLSGGEKAYNRIDENGDVYQTVSMAWPNKKKAPDDYFIPLKHPKTGKACAVPPMGWRNPSQTMKELLVAGQILFGKDETTQPRRKYLLKENMDENIPSLLYYGGSDTELLAELGIPFDTPKVVNIVKEHVQALTKPCDIVLDFFSGSATTAHAVMELNKADFDDRKFIMVQLPELTDEKSDAFKAGYKNICEIGKERIRRAGQILTKNNAQRDKTLDEAIEKIKKEYGEDAVLKHVPDVGFRVLKLDSTNMKDVYYNPSEYSQNLIDTIEMNIKHDRSPEDLLFQVMLEMGITLDAKIEGRTIAGKKVFAVNDDALIACFDDGLTDEVVTVIAKMEPLFAAFRDSGLKSGSVGVNFDQIFKAYHPTMKKEDRKVL